MRVIIDAVPFKIETWDSFYRVINPEGAKFYVYKNKSCSCGCKGSQRCPHVRAVFEYLKRGGLRIITAEEVALERHQAWEQRVRRFREKRLIAIANGEISDSTRYFLELLNLDSRQSFCDRWGLSYEVV